MLGIFVSVACRKYNYVSQNNILFSILSLFPWATPMCYITFDYFFMYIISVAFQTVTTPLWKNELWHTLHQMKLLVNYYYLLLLSFFLKIQSLKKVIVQIRNFVKSASRRISPLQYSFIREKIDLTLLCASEWKAHKHAEGYLNVPFCCFFLF